MIENDTRQLLNLLLLEILLILSYEGQGDATFALYLGVKTNMNKKISNILKIEDESYTINT